MSSEIFSKEDMIRLQKLLEDKKAKLTCAESCTGGLIASMITQIPGSSKIFNGSIIAYSNGIKIKELCVKKENIEKFGAVSIEVVKDMLKGVMEKFDSNYAIATSGVAGPTGGTKNKPVGTVVIGVASYKGVFDIDIYHFSGDRESIQRQSSKKSFEKFMKLFLNT